MTAGRGRGHWWPGQGTGGFSGGWGWGRVGCWWLVWGRLDLVFMGANQDSYAEVGRLGLDDGSGQDFQADHAGVREAIGSFNRAVGEYRGAAYEERSRRRKAFFGGKNEARGGASSRLTRTIEWPCRMSPGRKLPTRLQFLNLLGQ